MKPGILWGIGALALLSVSSPAQAELTLQVTPLQDGRDVDFGQARSLGPQGEPESDTVVRQVRLTITSTTGQPYQVFQRINEPWRNVAGQELPLESVLFYISEATPPGLNRFPNPEPMGVGEREIFISDGESGQLRLVYTIQVPPGQQTGDYRTTLSFRVVSR